MLGSSVEHVNSISEETNREVGELVNIGKKKVAVGTEPAKKCAQALNYILSKMDSLKNSLEGIHGASEEKVKAWMKSQKQPNPRL